MLKHRVMAALVFVPLLLWATYSGGFFLHGLCALICVLMYWEYQRMANVSHGVVARVVGYVLVLAAYASRSGLITIPLVNDGIWAVIGLAVLSVVLVGSIDIATAARRAETMLLGIFYCAGLLPYYAQLRHMDQGLYAAGMVLLCVWLSDTAAYFAGRAFGRHRLCPQVSPGKTIEGALAGLCASVAVGGIFVAAGWVLPGKTWVIGALLGLMVGVAGIVGDLCESLLKRSYGVKDSSQLIPGHGGFLDRFDSLIFAAPVAYYGILFLA